MGQPGCLLFSLSLYIYLYIHIYISISLFIHISIYLGLTRCTDCVHPVRLTFWSERTSGVNPAILSDDVMWDNLDASQSLSRYIYTGCVHPVVCLSISLAIYIYRQGIFWLCASCCMPLNLSLYIYINRLCILPGGYPGWHARHTVRRRHVGSPWSASPSLSRYIYVCMYV